MLITCPSCASEYVIDPAHLRPSGRTVRCASCRTTFFAQAEAETDELIYDMPDEPEPGAVDTLPGQADVDAAFAGLDGPDEDDGPASGARAERDAKADLVVDAQSRRARPSAAAAAQALSARGAGLLAGLGGRLRAAPLVALIAAAALAYGLLARESVVRAAPEMARIYGLVGLEVNLRGLSIERVVSTRFEEDGSRVLAVEGVVSNVAGGPRPVPDLAFSLRDETSTSLYSWTIEPPRDRLDPGESAPFRARLVAPPAEARQVSVRFAPASRATLARTSP